MNESFTEYLNPDGQWVLGPSLPEVRHQFGIALIKNSFVLIAGGVQKKTLYSEVQMYNINHGTWTLIGNLEVPTVGIACERYILVNGTTIIICVGGYQKPPTGNRHSNQAAAYNIDAGIWTMVPEWNLPMGCHFPNLQVVDGRLFIFGGFFEDGNNMRVLEFGESQIPPWKELANLPASVDIIIPLAIPYMFPHQD